MPTAVFHHTPDRYIPTTHHPATDPPTHVRPQAGGDTDRYIAAMLFGCVPVLLNSAFGRQWHGVRTEQALPLEEVLEWER